MTPKLNFAHNTNGKLLCDYFLTVRLHDGFYKIGHERQICLRNQPLGIAEITTVIQFKLKDLPDIIAFPDCGGNAEFLKKMMYRFYADLHEDSIMDVIAMHWTDRPPQLQESLFKNFWNKLEEKFQPTLFNS